MSAAAAASDHTTAARDSYRRCGGLMTLMSGVGGNRRHFLKDAPGLLQSFDGGGTPRARRSGSTRILSRVRGKILRRVR